jgi:Spy/CpxP family protein refolding chaperone
MVWHRLAVTGFTILALTSGSLFAAGDNDRLDALAPKLNLSDKQKEQVKQIYADFDKKADPLMRQLCTQRNEEWQGLEKVLNEEQRGKLKDAVQAQGAKELQSVAEKLSLSAEQKEQVKKIRQDFWKKFLKLSAEKGENMARDYRDNYMDVVTASREVLTPEQLAKLPEIQRQDFEEWHDFIFRHDHLKTLGDQLGLSPTQFKELQELCAAHEKKLEKSKEQLKHICKEECAALEKVLNAEQRAKLHMVFPLNFMGG